MPTKRKVEEPRTWEAFIMYDPTSGQRIGLYGSKGEAEQDCPNWRDEGYAISPCVIGLLKRFPKAR